MAYDAAGQELILTGGGLSAGGATLADTWSFDQGWYQLSPSTPPPAVGNAGLATDPRSGHLVLFGGATGQGYNGQTYVWGPLTLDAKTLAAAAVGKPYSQTVRATGATGTLSWRVSSTFPPGLSLSQSGVISGTPTAPGTYSFIVTVTDTGAPSQSVSGSFTITVNQGPIPGVYVANGANSQINGFALSANGNAAPVASLGGPATTLNGPAGLVFDQLGRLYVANSGASAVDVFAAGASGNVAPVSVLTGSQTGLSSPADWPSMPPDACT